MVVFEIVGNLARLEADAYKMSSRSVSVKWDPVSYAVHFLVLSLSIDSSSNLLSFVWFPIGTRQSIRWS